MQHSRWVIRPTWCTATNFIFTDQFAVQIFWDWVKRHIARIDSRQYIQASCSYCICSISMLHVYSSCPSCLFLLLEHHTCSFYISMLWSMLHVHVACPCFMPMLLVLVAGPSYMFILHVHSECQFCTSMLQVHAHVHVTWSCLQDACPLCIHTACPC